MSRPFIDDLQYFWNYLRTSEQSFTQNKSEFWPDSFYIFWVDYDLTKLLLLLNSFLMIVF